MEKGLGDLGFWLGLGIVIAAMIVSGALKERDKGREKQAMLRALLGREGEGISEILAYLREKDAAEAASAHAKRLKDAREARVAFAVLAIVLSLAIGFIALIAVPHPIARFPFPYPGYVPPPPPESGSHLVIAIGIWAAGLIKPVLGQLVDGSAQFMGVPVLGVLGVLGVGLALRACSIPAR